jgi:hypothetical protein
MIGVPEAAVFHLASPGTAPRLAMPEIASRR